MKKILIVIFVAMLSMMMISCKTKYVETQVPVEVTKTVYKNIEKYDSIYIHDSIDRFVKGDSIYIIKYRNQYKLKTIFDTVAVHDTIPITLTKTEVKTVTLTNPVNWTLLFISVASIVYFIFKLKSYVK